MATNDFISERKMLGPVFKDQCLYPHSFYLFHFLFFFSFLLFSIPPFSRFFFLQTQKYLWNHRCRCPLYFSPMLLFWKPHLLIPLLLFLESLRAETFSGICLRLMIYHIALHASYRNVCLSSFKMY